MSRFSSTVISWKMRRPSGTCTSPLRTILSAGMCMMSSPMNLMEPVRERSKPERVFKVVDLPAPFAPISATISPSFTSKEMFLMAWSAPYHTLML